MEEFESRIVLDTDTFINPAGGDWSDHRNWSLGRIPADGDDVAIPALPGDSGVVYPGKFLGASVTLDSMSLDGTLSLGGALGVTGSITGSGTIQLDGDLVGATVAKEVTIISPSGGRLSGVTLNGTLLVAGETPIGHGPSDVVISDCTVNGTVILGNGSLGGYLSCSDLSGTGSVVLAGTGFDTPRGRMPNCGFDATYDLTIRRDITLNCRNGSIGSIGPLGSFGFNYGTILMTGNSVLQVDLLSLSIESTGRLSMSDEASITVANLGNNGTVTLGQGNSIWMVGNVLSHGQGGYVQQATGTLNVQIGSPPASQQSPLLQVSGGTDLAGTLRASYINGFTPSQGQSFLIIGGSGGHAGTFDKVIGGAATYKGANVFLGPPPGYSPAQIRTAYGINNLSLDGLGQTIAIVVAYHDPHIFDDLDAFDQTFGPTSSGQTLYDDPRYGPASQFLRVVNQKGSPTPLPGTDLPGKGTWEKEEALDVEWAHAIAPKAAIIVVECESASLDDRMQGVREAGSLSSRLGVSVVSMSWGFDEGTALTQTQERAFDQAFVVPGVTFVASTGDFGSPGHNYSPNVVAVGGTTLKLDSQGNVLSPESGWGDSGGGKSQYEKEPPYQVGFVPHDPEKMRGIPDVSFDADQNTAVALYNSFPVAGVTTLWSAGDGTSLGAPCWAGLIALADEGRMAERKQPLTSSVPTYQTQTALYSLWHDFNDIDKPSVSNGKFSTGPGYDLVTGLGTPTANLLLDLINWQAVTLSPGSVPAGTAGVAYKQTITASSSSGAPYDFAVTGGALPAGFTLDTGTGVLSGTSTVAGTFSFVVTATDGAGATGTQSYSLTINPAPADHFRLDVPTTAVSGMPFNLTMTAFDPYGNVDINYAGTVTFASSDADPGVVLPADYTFTGGSGGDNGVHSFSGVVLITLGDQTVTATDTVASSITGIATVTISPGNAPPPGGHAAAPGKGHPLNLDPVILLASRTPLARPVSLFSGSSFELRGGMQTSLDLAAINHLFAVSSESRDALLVLSGRRGLPNRHSLADHIQPTLVGFEHTLFDHLFENRTA